MDIASSANSMTTILDLNSDCLIEILQNLCIEDLGEVADVCVSFRQNAQYVAQSKLKESLDLKCVEGKGNGGKWQTYSLIETARMLRNFGVYVQSVEVIAGINDSETGENPEIQKRVFQLLSKHCTGTLIELRIFRIKITEQIANILQPILLRLRKLRLFDCDWRDEDMQKLPLSAPLLRELKLEYDIVPNIELVTRFNALHCKFPNLESFSLDFGLYLVTRDDIIEFLALNPQLQRIKLFCVQVAEDHDMLQLIAENAPEIESIDVFLERDIPSDYIFHLRKLKALTLSGKDDYITSVVRAIGSSGIALEHLHFVLNGPTSTKLELVNGICELNTLKTLRLGECNFFFHCHILEICKKLSDLSELHLSYDGLFQHHELVQELDWSAELLLELVKSAKKLKIFKFRWESPSRKFCIDADVYMKIVEAVEERREKIHLLLDLPGNFTVNVPAEVAREHKNLLTVTSCLTTLTTEEEEEFP